MQAPDILNTRLLFYTFNDPHKVREPPTETALQTFSKNLESTTEYSPILGTTAQI